MWRQDFLCGEFDHMVIFVSGMINIHTQHFPKTQLIYSSEFGEKANVRNIMAIKQPIVIVDLRILIYVLFVTFGKEAKYKNYKAHGCDLLFQIVIQ